MGTSAGIMFKCSIDDALTIAASLKDIDEVTNAHGLGVACTPFIYHNNTENTFVVCAQTHWSYDGKNGRIFVRELLNFLKTLRVKIRVIKKYYI